MAKKTTLTAIDPSGKKHTRTTARTYTHVVFARRSRDWAMQNATTRHKYFNDNFWYSQAYIDGTSKWLEQARWEDGAAYGERKAREVESAKKANRGCATPDELWAIVRAEQVAAVEAVDFSLWEVIGWCGRRDLAEKLAVTDYHVEKTIVSVE